MRSLSLYLRNTSSSPVSSSEPGPAVLLLLLVVLAVGYLLMCLGGRDMLPSLIVMPFEWVSGCPGGEERGGRGDIVP